MYAIFEKQHEGGSSWLRIKDTSPELGIHTMNNSLQTYPVHHKYAIIYFVKGVELMSDFFG